ncbi:pentapeptide repeat-containing protein [Synechocystis sp. PCC 7509]|uniref:pentapeptide repeat-containing protein n=1 Tax=Synechocystis sp. PCC 7509 TaxID=927677 RepID=UPI0002AC7963|nr:pentapeptide repeat-containing protein [Synechocystis sp. PCC 7509]
MANPSVRRGGDRNYKQARLQPLPLVTRRFAAWAIEISIIASSAIVPYSVGMYAKTHLVEQVPLNPVLAVTEKVIIATFALPPSREVSEVPPLTNFLWSVALATPILLGSWQIYLLAKTGSTLPKRWLGVRVVTTAGNPPGLAKTILREGIVTWGLPLSIAYVVWRCSGLFPDPAMLTILAGVMVLGEGISARFDRQRRSLHDLISGTYVVNASRIYAPNTGRLGENNGQGIKWDTSTTYSGKQTAAPVSEATIVLTKKKEQQRDLWIWMRRHPKFVLTVVASCSVGTVVGTLIATQLYVRTQIGSGQVAEYNSEQLLAATKQLNATEANTLAQRTEAILNLGTVNNPQAQQLLVNLLAQSSSPELTKVIQQALVTSGTEVLPALQRLNLSLATNPAANSQQLQSTQNAIAEILSIYSGKLTSVQLDRINLSETDNFSLVLNQIDLAGIELSGANLDRANLAASHWQSAGNDGIVNTFDDAIATLNDAQMKFVNLTEADLSRVSMQRANLLHALLNRANLAHSNLSGANLSSAQMVETDLQQSVLTQASLTGADLGAANLAKADLSSARLSRVSALKTNFQLANLSATDWQGADLSGADLSSANLSNANLSAARLQNANLRQANLQNVSLRNADLRNADLRNADLQNADVAGAIFIDAKSTQADGFMQTPVAESPSVLLKGVDFTNVKNLDTTQLAAICLQGGNHPRCP